MSASPRAIALQAISVVVLGTIVYLAFLLPEDPGSLSEIEAGSGIEDVFDVPSQRSRRGSGPTAKVKSGSPLTISGGKLTRSLVAPGGAEVATSTKATTDRSNDVDSPTGSQYASSVALIRGRLLGE